MVEALWTRVAREIKLIDEFLAAWYHWTHYRRNGKSKKEQLEDMDKDIDYEKDIEFEEEKEKEESEDQRQG